MSMTRNRPFGVTLLAILAGISALGALWSTLQYLHVIPFTIGELQFYGFDPLGAILWAVLALIWVWVAARLWAVDPRGLMFAVVLSGLNLVMAGLSILGASTFEALLPAILLNGAVLLYCLTPGVRRAFGAGAGEFVPSGPPAAPRVGRPGRRRRRTPHRTGVRSRRPGSRGAAPGATWHPRAPCGGRRRSRPRPSSRPRP